MLLLRVDPARCDSFNCLRCENEDRMPGLITVHHGSRVFPRKTEQLDRLQCTVWCCPNDAISVEIL